VLDMYAVGVEPTTTYRTRQVLQVYREVLRHVKHSAEP